MNNNIFEKTKYIVLGLISKHRGMIISSDKSDT